jgi:hypothetical protein
MSTEKGAINGGGAEKPPESTNFLFGDVQAKAGAKMAGEANMLVGKESAVASLIPEANQMPVAFGASQFSLVGRPMPSDTNADIAGIMAGNKNGAGADSSLARLEEAANGGRGMNQNRSDEIALQRKTA